ncbi:hypothetical protein K432DRAFT_352633 [Lepidopterella palustris CBS 459.81]|uniref:Sterol regulatory element-binding protein cleavage-activating protein n=1 Tax=Lepidopterella palustris CBS 459.81 TaxID=1314670 RepID=A0A8E2JFH7_9PEZI|nr:hypothetical protein K432DRAFT_352633 [Lepidopterella palustris CBS 459.81]
MIWYILYPFRGTTEPPKLSQTHPIRRFFQRHGTATARHWLMSILLSVSIAVLLCYPVLFLENSPAATGLYNLPHHVWTSTTEVAGGDYTRVDVEMRQVWVHGDYMKALDRRVLREALRVQDVLIGDGFGDETTSQAHDYITQALGLHESGSISGDACVPRSTQNLSWGYHSPLMLWNCSLATLESDPDILLTIMSNSERHSFLNFTLRPSSIFAGKSFEKTRLKAADALVITLFDRAKLGISEAWEARSLALAKNLSDQWSMYPDDGKVTRSQLYEFRFKPMSFYDDLLLAAAYFIMAVYVLISLRKLGAVKSKFGLAITVFAKISVSIIASFTICGMLKINLARIPREAYPFVVLVIGLENIFRLINEVLSNPPEMSTVHRIGNALGEVGHLSLAAAGQNLIILWLLSRVVSPGVAAFCAYAAVALVFDFVFHLTFFLAVLSVDVRRMGLQDSLDQINIAQPPPKTNKQGKPSWFEFLDGRKLPFSTRIAGSAAIICFVFVLNWHFFDNGMRPFSFRRILEYALSTSKSANSSGPNRTPSPPIHLARTPAEWLRMQDHDTGKEFIRFIKPNAYSFIARVYDPLLIVLKGADGRSARNKPRSLLSVMRQLADRHFFPVALAVVLAIALVTMLVNYLLWNELPEDLEEDDTDEPLITVRTLPKSHDLDIVRLTASGKGHLVSISLDRSTSIWYHDRTRGYNQSIIKPASTAPPLWPIVATTIDDGGNWLALCTAGGRVAFWSLPQRRFLMSPMVELRGQLPTFFSFASMHAAEHEWLSLVIVTPDGCLSALDCRSGHLRTHQICCSTILSTALLSCAKGQTSIISASRNGEVHISKMGPTGDWTTEILQGFGPRLLSDGKLSKVRSVLTVSNLGLVFIVRLCEVDVIDFHSRTVIHTIQTSQVKPHSLRVMHSQRRMCHCGAFAIHSLAVIYTELESQDLLMHTYTLDETPASQICLRSPSDHDTRTCLGLDSAAEMLHGIQRAGAWEATHAEAVVGVRNRHYTSTPSSSASGVDSSYFSRNPGMLGMALKHRTRDGKASIAVPDGPYMTTTTTATTTTAASSSSDPADDWEAYSFSMTGEFYSTPLLPDPAEGNYPQEEQLFVATPGPIARLGKRGVAVGFGNTVKIVMLGNGRFEEDTDEFQEPEATLIAHEGRKKKRREVGRKGL